jgi:hypothetical protein
MRLKTHMSLEFNPYDIMFVAVILVFIAYDFYKEFLYSVVSSLKVGVSAWAGHYVSTRYAAYLYDQFMKEKLIEQVTEKLINFRDGLISSFGDDYIGRAISSYLKSSALGGDLSKTAESVVAEGLQETIVNGFQLILFVAVFVLLIIIISIIQGFLTQTNEIPLIGFVNRLLGGIFGALIGLFILMLIAMMCSVLLKYNVSFIDQQEILSSRLFSILFKLNPFFS